MATKQVVGKTLGGRLPGWHGAAIRAFEADFERELDLDECVAVAANTRQKVRAHYKAETGKEAPF
jgi:hypothetical protein